MDETARCSCPIDAQQMIVCTRRQDHRAAKDATALHTTQDSANLGANLFMIDEVELGVFKFFGIWFPHTTSLSIPCVWAEFTRVCI